MICQSPIWILVSLATLTVTYSYRIPNGSPASSDTSSNVLSFQRTSVESTPNFTDSFNKQNLEEYKSERLPLRDAVEAYPNNFDDKKESLQLVKLQNFREQDKRVPLRDAVERRVPPTYDGLDHKSIWLEQVYPPTLRSSQNVPYAVCHFEASGAYRSEPFSLPPQIIPSRKCTHIVYSAATLDPHELILIPRDAEYDEVKGGYKSVQGLRKRNPALRVLISIVSPDQGRLYKELINSVECCQKFISSVLDFLEMQDFDGIQLEWEDRSNRELKTLLRELYEPLKERGYNVVVAMKAEELVDAETINMMDFLILKTWRNHQNNYALHPAPLGMVIKTVKRWINGGLEARKLVLDVPIFGKSYTLKYKNATITGSPVVGPGLAGSYTLHQGFMAYYEICEKLEEQWRFERDNDGPYIGFGDQWIGFDDPIAIKLKMAYIRSVGLGGVSLKSLDLDDFQGICGDTWPILNAATETLGIYDMPVEKCWKDGLFSDSDNCSGFLVCEKGNLYRGNCGFGRFYDRKAGRCVKARPDICYPGHSDSYTSIDLNLSKIREKQQLEKLILRQDTARVVCYVTSWALYRKGEGKFVPEHLDARLCTDVIYAFAGLNPETLIIQPFDPWADIENNLYQRVTSIKGAKIMLALGGWTDSSGDKYSRLVNSASSRRKFVAAAVNFLQKHNFQGLSIEWNYPKCWQSDCKKGPESDRPNFTKLLQELRNTFDQQEPKLTLAVVLSGYKEIIDRSYEVKEIMETVDFASVMTYDYHGSWEPRTNHLAPLYFETGDTNPYYNVNFTMEYLVSLGAKRSKLIVGVPMYGQAYRLSLTSHSDLGDSAAGPGTPGEFTWQPGMLAYYEICDRIKKLGWKTGPGPSAHKKDQWVGYDNVKSIAEKGEYILKNGFGGAMAWTVDLDDFVNRCCTESFPLLRSLNRALGRLLTSAPLEENCEKPAEPVTPQPPTLTTHSDADDGRPKPTKPMATTSTTKATTWPTWTEKPTSQWTSTSTTPSTTTSWSWTTTTRKPTTVVTTTTDVQSVDSTVRPGIPCTTGQHIADPHNCGNYFRCVLGELRREQCAPGLHWDAKRGLCDWPSTAKCQRGTATTTIKPNKTTVKPTYTSTKPSWTQRPTKPNTPEPTEKPKQECEHGHYYAFPDSCTSFLICVNGNLVKHQCGPGLNWNEKRNMCDWAFKNPCNGKQIQHAALFIKETDEHNCVPGTYSPVPGDCESYRACLWGRHEVFQCAPGLHFNKDTRICDWPSRAKCQGSSAPVSTMKPIYDSTSLTGILGSSTTKKPLIQDTTLPSAEIDPDKKSPLSGYFKVVCYFTNWAWYRRGLGRYLPEHIDHTLCTHIVYGFAVLDYSELTIKAHDSWADFDNRFYERVVAYKKRGLKVSLALGGWNDSAGDKYSRLVNNPVARKKFVDHVIKFIEKYDFDGLDLDWEYPVCWQVDCKKGPASDKEGFSKLLKELSAKFKPKGLLLSAAVSPSKKVIDYGYDVPTMAEHLSWIAVMTYDFHGQWDKKTGHVAPLYYHPDDDYYYFNSNYSINYWISKGAPPRSIVMGMPLYGQSFTINDPTASTNLNTPASAGQAGEFTKAAGFLAYYEICDRIQNRGWTVIQDPQRRMGPYAYKNNQWVSFDDSDMIRQKAQYIRDMNLGGGMVWALDLDDFRGKCNEGPHPLMHTLQQVLTKPPNKHDRPIKTPFYGQELEWKPETHVYSDTSTQWTNAVMTDSLNNDDYKVVCYFTNWAWYRQNGGRFVPEDIDSDLCTHILYGFAVLDGSSYTIKTHDSWADLDNKFYERVVSYKSKGKKVLIAIGGWNDSAGDKYSRLVNSLSARKQFISHILQFIEKYGFDGLDLDWEYPVCWQVDCKKGPKSDKEAFSNFIQELSAEFKPRGLLLSSAVSPSKKVIDEGYDVPVLAKYLDWIAVMTYDFHGQWDKKTGHVAPLYEHPDDWELTFNANFSINYWIKKGAPSKKLVMGAPLYGQSFSLADRSNTGLNSPTYGGGEAGEATRARGFLAYYEICERTLQKGWTVVIDPERRIGPYAYKGDQWVSFDDAKQIKLKAELIKSLDLGGGMVWALDLDDFKNRCGCESSPLLKTMNRVLRNYPDGPLCSITGIIQNHPNKPPKPIHTPEMNYPTDGSTTESDSIEIDAGPTHPALPPIGECSEKLFLPHKYDCSKYLLCNFGQFSEQSCPNGLYWNVDRCDWPENTKCEIEENKEVHVHVHNP